MSSFCQKLLEERCVFKQLAFDKKAFWIGPFSFLSFHNNSILNYGIFISVIAQQQHFELWYFDLCHGTATAFRIMTFSFLSLHKKSIKTAFRIKAFCLQTIPTLIEGLHDMTSSVVKQRKVTNTYAKVFLECVDCKP